LTKVHAWLKTHHVLWIVVLAFTIFVTRGLALDQYVSLDEVSWLRRSANFYYALGQRDFVQTRHSVDPAVTTMWVNTAAFVIEAPQYRVYGQGYFEDFATFDQFARSRNIDPHEVLITGRKLMLLENIILLLTAFVISIRLVGVIPAFSAFMLIALDPFHIEWTTISHTDGQLSCLMLLSVISFLAYFFEKPKLIYVLISALTASLACLTKLPGYLLFVFFIGFLLYEVIRQRRLMSRQADLRFGPWVRRTARDVGIWIGVFVLFYVALWPAMWVEPVKTLQRQITAPFIFVDREDMLSRSDDISNTIDIDLPEKIPGIFQRLMKYPAAIVWRATPVVLLGLLLALLFFIFKRGILGESSTRRLSIVIMVFAGVFILIISLADMQNVRYMMPAIVMVDMLAAFGWVALAQVILSSKKTWLRLSAISAVLVFVAVVQVGGNILVHPYYGSYHNPLMGGAKKAGETLFIGSGEGLDEAGRYLSAKPDASNLTVISWYGNGSFSYYFSGKTVNMPVRVNNQWIAENIAGADYMVVYTNQWYRNRTPHLFEVLAQVKPEHSIWINEIEYARIYRVEDIPSAIFTY
jgi:hypothetical protein